MKRSREDRLRDLEVRQFHYQSKENDLRNRPREDKPIFWRKSHYDPDKEIMYWIEDK